MFDIPFSKFLLLPLLLETRLVMKLVSGSMYGRGYLCTKWASEVPFARYRTSPVSSLTESGLSYVGGSPLTGRTVILTGWS